MTKTSASFLLAGLMAVAGFANAQNTGASATNSSPAKAGEASTMTQGVPNAAVAVGEKTRADVKAEATAANNAGTSTNVPAGNPSPAMGQGTAK